MHSYQFKEHISFIYTTICKDKTAAQLGDGGTRLLSQAGLELTEILLSLPPHAFNPHGLNLECPLEAHMLKAWPLVCGTISRCWKP